MKNLLKILTLMLALCLVLCACGNGESGKSGDNSVNDTTGSVQTTACPNDGELIIGQWKGTIDCGDYLGEVLAGSVGEEVAAYFDFGGIGFDIALTFSEAGTYTLTIDESSLDTFAEDVVEELHNGLRSYMEMTFAEQLGEQTLDEYLAANNMDFDQMMTQSGVDAEILAEQMASSFKNAEIEGKYAFEEGMLSMDGDLHPYELDTESLTIEVPDGVSYELMEVLFPMELERIG